MYASGITFTGVQSSSPAAGTLIGANNGLSVSSITPGIAVLGQDVGQAGSPAALLSNREIPGTGFRLNLFNGRLILSDAQNSGLVSPLGRLEVYETITASNSKRVAYFQQTANTATAAANSGITINQVTTDNGPIGIIAFDIRKNNTLCFTVNPAFASTTFNDPFGAGAAFASFTGARYNNTTLRNAAAINPNLQINSLWHPNAVVTPAQVVDIEVISTVTLDNAAEVNYTGLLFTGTYSQGGTSTGSFRGVYFQPNIVPPLVNTPIAFENTEGHVFLCNHIADANAPGRVAIAEDYNIGDTPTALLQIGPSDGSAGGGSLKLDAGALVAVPENGLMENDGTNFYITLAGVRKTIVLL